MKGKIKPFLQGCLAIAALVGLWALASKTGIFGKMDPEDAELLLPMPQVVCE